MSVKHDDVPIVKNVRGAGKNTESTEYQCHHCDSEFRKRANLDRHVRSVHTATPTFNCPRCRKGSARSLNLEMHMRTCTGVPAAAVSSTSTHRGGAASCSSASAHMGRATSSSSSAAFTVQRGRRALGGVVEVHTIDMADARQLAALEDAVGTFEPTMAAYRRGHNAYKLQIVVKVGFH